MATIRTLIGNIKGPKGDPGTTGPTGPTGPGATITVGSVSTTDYGNPVQITNSGTETDAILDFVIPQGKPGEETTKMSNLTLDTITTQSASYPIPAVGDTGATAWGKIVKFFNDIRTAIASKINYSDCVTVLTSTDNNKPLAASQGKALNDALPHKVDYTASSTGVLHITVPSSSRHFIIVHSGSVDRYYIAYVVCASNGSVYVGEVIKGSAITNVDTATANRLKLAAGGNASVYDIALNGSSIS